VWADAGEGYAAAFATPFSEFAPNWHGTGHAQVPALASHGCSLEGQHPPLASSSSRTCPDLLPKGVSTSKSPPHGKSVHEWLRGGHVAVSAVQNGQRQSQAMEDSVAQIRRTSVSN
jgi:hypothetical protein